MAYNRNTTKGRPKSTNIEDRRKQVGIKMPDGKTITFGKDDPSIRKFNAIKKPRNGVPAGKQSRQYTGGGF